MVLHTKCFKGVCKIFDYIVRIFEPRILNLSINQPIAIHPILNNYNLEHQF